MSNSKLFASTKGPNVMIRFAVISTLATAVAATVWFANTPTGNSQLPLQPVQHDSAPGAIYAVGRVEGATEEVELRPLVTGVVAKLFIKENDEVEEGQPLLQLDNKLQTARVALAESELSTARLSLSRLRNGNRKEKREEADALLQVALAEQEQLRLSYQRAQPLHRDGVLAAQEFDDLRMRFNAKIAEVEAAKFRRKLINAPAREDDLAIAEAKVNEAQARLAIAKEELARTTLVAPSAGRVLDLNVNLGEHLSPDSHEPAARICQLKTFHARAYVDELDAARVQLGMTANVSVNGNEQSFTGKVVRLSSRMGRKKMFNDEPSERIDTRTRELWIELNASDLIVGQRVDVYLRKEPTSELVNVASH